MRLGIESLTDHTSFTNLIGKFTFFPYNVNLTTHSCYFQKFSDSCLFGELMKAIKVASSMQLVFLPDITIQKYFPTSKHCCNSISLL